MGKLGVLTFTEGDFDKKGFSVTLQLGEEGKPATIQEIGSLPPNSELIESYNSWKVTYYGFIGVKARKLEAKLAQITNFSILNVKEKADYLKNKFNQWLKSTHFSHVREELVAHLQESDQVRLIIQTSNIQLRKLPWHLWDILERYPKAEISVSAPKFKQVKSPKQSKNQVNILAILGDDQGINVEEDRKILKSIPGAEVEFLVKPKRQELNDQLWEQSWDILFFAGHSHTEGETGTIYINRTESLTIDDLRYALKKALRQGLQLAIFNSCDGLGLAQDLADLNLPQIIVMREPVPDKVAQEFLKYFLRSFSQGQSFYLAVKEARERLQGLESDFPCASWLPVICQNLGGMPMTLKPFYSHNQLLTWDWENSYNSKYYIRKIIYRRIVEKYAFIGEPISISDKRLDTARIRLGILANDAMKIEAEALKKNRSYQDKLVLYNQVISEVIQQEYPISPQTHDELEPLQEILGIKETDIVGTENKCLKEKEATICVTIVMADGTKKALVELPGNLTIGQLMLEALENWQIPSNIVCEFRLGRTGSMLADTSISLIDAGVISGDALILYPICCAG